MNRTAALSTSILTLLAIAVSTWLLSDNPSGRPLTFALLTGTALGIALQRTRFCFLCSFRDLVEQRDPRGIAAIVLALAVGTILYAAVMMAWMPVPQPGRLPPNAHIGPVSSILALGAFAFGIGMAISGSCLSGHFYRLGEGSPTAPFAIVGAGLGFLVGFLTWNPLYLAVVSESEAIWLPHHLGYAGSVSLSLAILAVIGTALFAFGRWEPQPGLAPGLRNLAEAMFVRRWPAAVGGTVVGIISAIYYLRVAPLGVTAELGSIARTAGMQWNLLPETLLGLDTLRGCATVVKETLLSNNGLLVLGLIAGSLASALAAGQFKPALPTKAQALKGIAGGLLLGWGSMTALGCTVGVLLSGIHAGALSGWVFLIFCSLGTFIGLKAVKALSRKAT